MGSSRCLNRLTLLDFASIVVLNAVFRTFSGRCRSVGILKEIRPEEYHLGSKGRFYILICTNLFSFVRGHILLIVTIRSVERE